MVRTPFLPIDRRSLQITIEIDDDQFYQLSLACNKREERSFTRLQEELRTPKQALQYHLGVIVRQWAIELCDFLKEPDMACPISPFPVDPTMTLTILQYMVPGSNE